MHLCFNRLVLLILKMSMACSGVSLTRPGTAAGSSSRCSTRPSGGKLGVRSGGMHCSRSWKKTVGNAQSKIRRPEVSRFEKTEGGEFMQEHSKTEFEKISVLQHVAVCCSVLQRVAAFCSVLPYVAVCCSVLQYVVVYRMLQRDAACCGVPASRPRERDCVALEHTATHCNSMQHTATRRNTLRHTATQCNTR